MNDKKVDQGKRNAEGKIRDNLEALLAQETRDLSVLTQEVQNLMPVKGNSSFMDYNTVKTNSDLASKDIVDSIAEFYLDVERCHSFYTNWKRSHNLGRNTLYNDEKLREYEKLKFKVEELQIASKEIYKLKNSMKILETI